MVAVYYKKYIQALYFIKYYEIYLYNINTCTNKKELEKMKKEFQKQEKNLQEQENFCSMSINELISKRHYKEIEKEKICGYKYNIIHNDIEIITKKEKYYKF